MNENGCTCGNLVYDSNIVGATGHMMNCPVYRILKLEGDVEGAKEYARLLQDDMRKVMAQRDTLSNRVKELEVEVAALKIELKGARGNLVALDAIYRAEDSKLKGV